MTYASIACVSSVSIVRRAGGRIRTLVHGVTHSDFSRKNSFFAIRFPLNFPNFPRPSMNLLASCFLWRAVQNLSVGGVGISQSFGVGLGGLCTLALGEREEKLDEILKKGEGDHPHMTSALGRGRGVSQKHLYRLSGFFNRSQW